MRVGKEDANNTNYQETKRKDNKIKKKIFFSKKFSKYKQTQEKETPIKFLCKKKNYFKTFNKEEHHKKKMERHEISKEGRWTEEEHNLFLEGIVKYGTVWKNVKKLIKTRTSVQVRSHAQKFYLKMKAFKDNELGIDFTVNSIKAIKDMIALIKLKNYDVKNTLLYLNKKCDISKKPKIIENNDNYINNINYMFEKVTNNVNNDIKDNISNNNYINDNINNIINNRLENRIGFDNINLNKNIECNNNGNYFKSNYFNNNYNHLLLNNNNYNILENLQNNFYYNNLLHNLGNNYININNYNLSFPNTNIINNQNYIIDPFFINNIINNENEALKCFFINNIINNRSKTLNQNSLNNSNEILNNKLFINNNINEDKNKDMSQLFFNNNSNQNKEVSLGNKSETINYYLNNNIYSGLNDINSYSNIQFQSPLLSSLLPNSSLLNINNINNNNDKSLFDSINRKNLLLSQNNNNNINSNLLNSQEKNLDILNSYLHSLESKNNINNICQPFLNDNNNIQNQLENSNQMQINTQIKSNQNPINIGNSVYSNIFQKDINRVEKDIQTNKDLLIKDIKKSEGNTK